MKQGAGDGVAAGALRDLARDVFGFDGLRPGQREAAEAAAAGRDVLAVLPTGSGKSAIYQLAALARPGPTVVVSPLIALQRDQVQALTEGEVATAGHANSDLSAGDRRELFEALGDGDLEFLFLAPEQLARDDVVDELRKARPSLFVVDEAHCISSWGHDFRPDYLRLGAVADAVGRPPILALTATAAPPVRHEIAERLGLRDPVVVVRGFDRPNIWLGVERFADESGKTGALCDRVASAAKPGIVYVATRRTADELAARLAGSGIPAAAYHAGLRAAERSDVHDRFLDDTIEVIVATTAFGMGIDKPNVRFVFHHDIAESLDSYYQEIGRAGRDGSLAEAVLFYRPEDVGLRRFFAAGGNFGYDQLLTVLHALADAGGTADAAALSDATGLHPTRLTAALARLADAGAVEVDASGRVEAVPGRDLVDAATQAAGAEESRERVDRSRVQMMQGYAEGQGCRRQALLSYFGERLDEPCGNCDECEAGRGDAAPADATYAPGATVQHKQWGPGRVMRVEEDTLVVLFDGAGYKTLSAALLAENPGLLRAATDREKKVS